MVIWCYYKGFSLRENFEVRLSFFHGAMKYEHHYWLPLDEVTDLKEHAAWKGEESNVHMKLLQDMAMPSNWDSFILLVKSVFLSSDSIGNKYSVEKKGGSVKSSNKYAQGYYKMWSLISVTQCYKVGWLGHLRDKKTEVKNGGWRDDSVVKTLTALPEVLSSIPSNHMLVHNYL